MAKRRVANARRLSAAAIVTRPGVYDYYTVLLAGKRAVFKVKVSARVLQKGGGTGCRYINVTEGYGSSHLRGNDVASTHCAGNRTVDNVKRNVFSVIVITRSQRAPINVKGDGFAAEVYGKELI